MDTRGSWPIKSATLGQYSTSIRANANSTSIHPHNCYQTSVNHCPLGTAACPAEVISVPLQDRTFVPLTVMFDSGSQHSIANAACHSLVLDVWRTAVPLEFATLNGCTSKVCEVVNMKIGDYKSIEAIVVNVWRSVPSVYHAQKNGNNILISGHIYLNLII